MASGRQLRPTKRTAEPAEARVPVLRQLPSVKALGSEGGAPRERACGRTRGSMERLGPEMSLASSTACGEAGACAKAP
eukprot:14293038-Alexandrium_andersonii.AAC.1